MACQVCRYTGKLVWIRRCVTCTQAAPLGTGAFGDRIRMHGWRRVKKGGG